MIASEYIEQGFPTEKVFKKLGLCRSSYYYRPVEDKAKVGRPPSQYTRNESGDYIKEEQVVKDIKSIQEIEFVDYGYLKMTYALIQEFRYIINHKKVYRIMLENQLLGKRKKKARNSRRWVTDLVPQPQCNLSYFEIDIKYIYIQGCRRNAMLLSIIDVKSRWLIGQSLSWSVNKYDVIKLFDEIFSKYYLPLKIYVRNDNGSQFEASLVQQYFAKKKIVQEFTRPATPEQNAHIESYHSIIESVLCSQYEFDHLEEAKQVFERFREFYNHKRIHSGLNYISPYKYLLNDGIDMNNTMTTLNCKKYLHLSSP